MHSQIHSQSIRSNHQKCSVKKGVLRNFAKFTGKHLYQSLFFNKVSGGACNFLKKETLTQVFSCEFCEISMNIFLTEHLWATASEAFWKSNIWDKVFKSELSKFFKDYLPRNLLGPLFNTLSRLYIPVNLL